MVINFCRSFPNDKFCYSSKFSEFADDNFKFDENGINFSKTVENCGKGEILVMMKMLVASVPVVLVKVQKRCYLKLKIA